MNDLERHMVETGRVIQKRYLLQKLIKQGQVCKVYQGNDQVLQRAVAVKVVAGEHIGSYRAAIRSTSQFAHPHIVGIYDLIIESDALYIVQEYVEGDSFAALLQKQLTPYEVADLGLQVCRALIYAGSPARKVCHGDLTPGAVIRDRWGHVRVNNFALPSDIHYFTSWSIMGGDGKAIADQDLAFGQQSDGRRADDTRAVGLLMYQLLTSRAPGTDTVEPPADGRLRFQRNVPPELCDLIARIVIRQHPQHITTAEALYPALKTIAEALEPPIVIKTRPLVDESGKAPSVVSTGQLSHAPTRETTGQLGFGPPHTEGNAALAMETALVTPGSPTVSDMSVKLAAAREAAYAQRGTPLSASQQQQERRLNIPVLLGTGLLLFALFFALGYFLANTILP